jgi:alpha-amylase
MMVNLVDNHDVPRFTNAPPSDASTDEVRRRYHLALTAMFTLPGIPQIYYGNEIGMFGSDTTENRKDMPSWAWTDAGRTAATTARTTGQTLPSPQLTYDYIQTLAGIRTKNPAFYDGYYAEMKRQNGSGNPNVYAFFRAAGDSRFITAINNGTSPSGLVSLDLKNNPDINSIDKAALPDGTVMTDLLGSYGQGVATISEGAFKVNLNGQSAGIYRPSSGLLSFVRKIIVTFKVRTDTIPGQNIYLVGSTQELGAWDITNRRIKMTPSNCTGNICDWTVPINPLPVGQAMNFKFTRDDKWESGPDRSFTVPDLLTATYDGGSAIFP